MCTRAKQEHVASDRARRPDVPRHILFIRCYKTRKYTAIRTARNPAFGNREPAEVDSFFSGQERTIYL